MSRSVRVAPLLVPVAVGAVVWVIPAPDGVAPAAWQLLAIFVATIAGIVLKPLPMGAVAMIGIAVTAATGTLPIGESLGGFANPVIWLIVVAFFISRGFIKTGLGERIAYHFLARLGRSALGLAYGLICADLVLAPAIPSNTARGGGVVYPVLRSIARVLGSDPEDGTAGRIGTFLTLASFQGLVVTSAMFLTAMAANPLAATLAAEQGVALDWGTWALAASVPGLLSLAVVPWLLYRLETPGVTETPGAAVMAGDRLAAMGPMSRAERVLLATFLLLIVLWAAGRTLGIHSTAAALVGLAVLLLAGVLTWDDVLAEHGAWDTLVWFAALVMMASNLNRLGLIPWFGERVGAAVQGQTWLVAFLVLALVYFYSHYLFASNTAHVSSMYAAFLAVAIVAGTPPALAALVLGFFSNLFGGLTHYGTGPAPVYFGSGYVPMATWWRVGLLASFANVTIWLGVGGAWWKLLGYW